MAQTGANRECADIDGRLRKKAWRKRFCAIAAFLWRRQRRNRHAFPLGGLTPMAHLTIASSNQDRRDQPMRLAFQPPSNWPSNRSNRFQLGVV
jgi:hypothetical protein